MILSSMDSNYILEAGMPGEPGAGIDPSSEFPEATPLKKYELLDKLGRMKSILKSSNIYDNDLDDIISFGSELSYETLLALTNSIVDRLSKYIAGIKNNEEKEE